MGDVFTINQLFYLFTAFGVTSCWTTFILKVFSGHHFLHQTGSGPSPSPLLTQVNYFGDSSCDIMTRLLV